MTTDKWIRIMKTAALMSSYAFVGIVTEWNDSVSLFSLLFRNGD